MRNEIAGFGYGNGYDGNSMSNNARAAYADGEKPFSKWTKAEIIDAVAKHYPSIAKKLKSVSLSCFVCH